MMQQFEHYHYPDGKRYIGLTFGREEYDWYWGFTLVVACLDDGEVYGA